MIFGKGWLVYQEIDAVIPKLWTPKLSLRVQLDNPLQGGWWGLFDVTFARPSLVSRHRTLIFTVDATYEDACLFTWRIISCSFEILLVIHLVSPR